SAGPVQVRMRMLVALQQATVGGDDANLEHVVRGGSVGTGEEADPTAEREPGYAHARARPGRNADSVLPEGRVDVDQPGARADRRRLACADRDPIEARDVNDHARSARVAAVAVSTGPGCDAEGVLPGPAQRLLHVGRRPA